MEFISLNSVTVTNGVDTYPHATEFTWADTTHPLMTIDTAVNTVMHITNWQGTETQYELLTGGYLFDYASGTPNVYRIVAAQYHNANQGGNAIDLYLNKAFTGTAAGTEFRTIPFNGVSGLFSILLRLISGVATIRNAADTTTSTLAAVNQRITISPASNIRAYVEPVVIDTTATGEAEGSNSK